MKTTRDRLMATTMICGVVAMAMTAAPAFAQKANDVEEVVVTGSRIARKDFIANEQQILEARAVGADIILLIVAGLAENDAVGVVQIDASVGVEHALDHRLVLEGAARDLVEQHRGARGLHDVEPGVASDVERAPVDDVGRIGWAEKAHQDRPRLDAAAETNDLDEGAL